MKRSAEDFTDKIEDLEPIKCEGENSAVDIDSHEDYKRLKVEKESHEEELDSDSENEVAVSIGKESRMLLGLLLLQSGIFFKHALTCILI